jgi:hypothetical protein
MRAAFITASFAFCAFAVQAQTNQVTSQTPAIVTNAPGMTDFQQKIIAAIWGAIAGGLMSLIVNLIFNVIVPRMRRWKLTRRVSIWTDPPSGGHTRFRIVNDGFWTINDATLYITLDVQSADVIAPPNGNRAHIHPHNFVPITGDQLCWSVRHPTINPMRVPIYAKERQPFSPCLITPNWISIPSEEGWPPDNYARVFLRRRRYTGTVKLVSADTNARCFKIIIDPDCAANPCTIEPTCCPEPLVV